MEMSYKGVMENEFPEAPDLKGLRLRQPNRSQTVLRAECPEDLVPENHPVRVIWTVTGRLDLSAFYTSIRALEGQAGRDATDPRLLVALWLYAATQGVGSARELARLCQEHRAYVWLCGGVSVNYHSLSDFRVGHGPALDALLTQVLAVLLEKELVQVWRISQDGTRVRACVGTSSFRRRDRLKKLHQQACAHVAALRRELEDPALSAQVTARQRSARERAAQEQEKRLEEALAQLPELEQREQQRQVAQGKVPDVSQLRVSTTDPQTRVLRMSDGGYRPAVNVQLACDPDSRAIVGVAVCAGADAGQSEPLRRQVEERTGRVVKEQLLDGGYLNLQEIEQAAQEDVTLYVPARVPKNPEKRKHPYESRSADSPAVAAWRKLMGSETGQTIYKLRGAISETVNADLKCYRGLQRLSVRGLDKVRCVVLWSALAYNLLHFGTALLS